MEKIKNLTFLKKVTKNGENTFAVSIPIKFIRDNDLKKILQKYLKNNK